MNSAQFKIHGRSIGAGHPCYVIGEAGVNHNGDLELAIKLIDAAARAGVDAVKFQTFDADRLVTDAAPKAGYQLGSTDSTESQHAMLKKLQLTPGDQVRLKEYANSRNLAFLTTAFDERSADFVESLVDAFKVPSGELTNTPFLRHLAAKNKAMIVSTGMSDLDEVLSARDTIRVVADVPLIFLHCVSSYPADSADTNLKAMVTMASESGCPCGFSDHSMGIEIPLAAVALGASIIEKHFTLDRKMEGPDHEASLEPLELEAMVQGIRKVESALGDGKKVHRPVEVNMRQTVRKSVAVVRNLTAGHRLLREDLICLRPGTGIAPGRLESLLGRTLKVPVSARTLLSEEDLA